jgi:hypothetical protein
LRFDAGWTVAMIALSRGPAMTTVVTVALADVTEAS